MSTDPQTAAESLESIRRALAAVASDRPTPEQIGEWNAADKEMAQRIRAALPGVPLHHAYAVLQALRVTQRLDAAAASAVPVAAPPTGQAVAEPVNPCTRGATFCGQHGYDCPPLAGQATLRDRIRRAVCEAEGFAWDSDMLEPDEYGDVADMVLAVLPAPVGRGAVLREEAARIRAHCPDHLDSDSAEGAWLTCHCAVADDMERRLAAEPQPDTQDQPRFVRVCTPCPGCDHTLDENGACANGCRPPAVTHPPTLLGAAELEEKLDLDVTPLTGDTLTGGETQGAPEEWCKCRSCWGWFVEEHPGEDLDELGRDLGWWSGLPVHRDAPAGVSQPEVVHACPPGGSGLTPCCGRTPFELPRTDRITRDPNAVTCTTPPAFVAEPGKENDRG